MYTDNDNPHQLPVEKLEAIDQACIAFERGLLNGETPEIERCLDTVHDPDAKSVLLAELIALEIEYRTASGGSTKREDYVRRFPENSDAVDAAFQSDRVHTKRHDVVPPVESFNLNSEFKISRFHARGGLGVVYVAKDQELGREVAVKFARHRDLDDSQRLIFGAKLKSRDD